MKQMGYPFTAIIGQEKVKKALIMNVVNPKIGGVLISGERGTAKSTMVRALGELLKKTEVVNLPLNVTEEMVAGTINVDKIIKTGVKEFEEGLLAKANGNILYIDEVNLLSDGITKIILDAASAGVSRVERDGLSFVHAAKFTLVGTMNPEEGQLSPQFLDRFGLYVTVTGEESLLARTEIIKRRLQFESDPVFFNKQFEADNQTIREKIRAAQQLMREIAVSDEIINLCASIALEANCSGHRADLFLIEAAKAIAALSGQVTVTNVHVKEAAQYVLIHRMREKAENNQEQTPDNETDINGDEQNKEKDEKNSEQDNGYEQDYQQEIDPGFNELPEELLDDKDLQINESIVEIGEHFKIKQLFKHEKDRHIRKGSGKRSRTRSGTKQGRFVKTVMSSGDAADLALIATIRAAAPFQKIRKGTGNVINITAADFRKKVREKRIGNTLLFAVDASGSMGAKQRMKAVKGATLSILNDAYQKRDSVGMIAFRKDSAEVILDITRSVDLAQKKLQQLPTGGKTPLAHGLYLSYERLSQALKKDPEVLPILIVVTDGKANTSMSGGNPVEEALEIAHKIALTGIQSLVIDTENNFINLGIAKEIAKALQADYYKLDELEADNIVQAVQAVL